MGGSGRTFHVTTGAVVSLFSLFGIASVLAQADITDGPLAPVSLASSNSAYTTARDCAANCLEYRGIWVCGVNGGYFGLGEALQCGCASVNGCFCSTGYASSATAYLSSCVSSQCAEDNAGWTSDLQSMLGLYDDYCATANVEQATNASPSTTAGGTESTGTAVPTTTGPSTGQTGTVARPSATSTTSPAGQTGSAAAEESDGLAKSDIIALAASLGVGIPSLLIAALTLYVQIRKRRRNEARRMSVAVQGAHSPETIWGAKTSRT
jgi:hypothetical protein